MFWIGLLVALVAGVLSIGYARSKIVAKYPRLNRARLDILLAILLLIGLLVSAADHLQTEAQLASIRDNIVSAAATVDLVLDWPLPKGNASWSAYLTGNVGYVAFGRRGLDLLVIRSHQVIMKSVSAQQVSLVELCDLNAPESVVRSSLHDLIGLDLLQLGLPDTVPEATRVASGSVKVTLNGNREVVIPAEGAVVHNAKIVLELHGLSPKRGEEPNSSYQLLARGWKR